ncbi:uncharacterized protein BX664DRAFT_387381 [Halteromyces radiatus]|uniref:uncharacterized protein n=1 Tax=Halteromyces radiatus TaxID=101107 RepID=UPI00221F767D|nr:uncharacterized protein BX664DRAFT_387381 [Halteromyces radiatus]KAI8084676.1 hypothetical protein BX664DRAFT_387381 [Halteromyces radiatus]
MIRQFPYSYDILNKEQEQAEAKFSFSCKKCHSEDVDFLGATRTTKKAVCNDCGHKWHWKPIRIPRNQYTEKSIKLTEQQEQSLLDSSLKQTPQQQLSSSNTDNQRVLDWLDDIEEHTQNVERNSFATDRLIIPKPRTKHKKITHLSRYLEDSTNNDRKRPMSHDIPFVSTNQRRILLYSQEQPGDSSSSSKDSIKNYSPDINNETRPEDIYQLSTDTTQRQPIMANDSQHTDIQHIGIKRYATTSSFQRSRRRPRRLLYSGIELMVPSNQTTTASD